MRLLIALLLLAGCAVGTGILPVGPGVFTVSERRAPVLGGGAEAQRAALAEAHVFCARQGGVAAPLDMALSGSPWGHFGPTDFTVTFKCRPS